MARLLIDAILNGAEAVALEILQNGKYGCIDSQTAHRDGTALFKCCTLGHLELANRLIEKGASISSRDKSESTPLHAAVDNGHLDLVNLLIHHNADLDAQTYRGDTPLHLAAYRGYQEITQRLVEAGADIGIVNSKNITPFNEAISNQYYQLANYLAAVHNLRHPEGSLQSLDETMIQLDPPSNLKKSEISNGQSQHQHNHNRQQQQLSILQKEAQPPQRNQHRHQPNQLTSGVSTSHPVTLVSHTNSIPRPKISVSGATEQDFNNLSVIKLDPPSEEGRLSYSPTHLQAANQRRDFKRRVSDTTDYTPTVNATTLHRKASCTSPVIRSPPPIPVSTSLTYQTTSSSLQPPLFQHGNDLHRRPSSGSTGSSFSDISGGTGSDISSSLSTGSEASWNGNCARREEMDLQDVKVYCIDYVGDRSKESSNMPQIRGVRFPPSSPSYFRRGSVTSPPPYSSEFSDIYDSSNFSYSSLKSSGPPSSLLSGSSLMSVDSIPSDSSRYSTNYEARACSPPIRLARATSVHHYNGAETALKTDAKTRPCYNKCNSTEGKPVYRPEIRAMGNGQSNMLSINDLSSTTPSSSNFSASSMTCVNIPPS